MSAMFVSQNSSAGVALFSYENAFFCRNKFAWLLAKWVKILCFLRTTIEDLFCSIQTRELQSCSIWSEHRQITFYLHLRVPLNMDWPKCWLLSGEAGLEREFLTMKWFWGWGWGERGIQHSFIWGGSALRSNTLPSLIFSIFERTCTAFTYLV